MGTKFKSWVNAQGGVTQVAAKLSIDAMAVRNWIDGRTSPKALTMQKLVQMGKGAFDYDDIINESKKQKRRTP